MKIAVIWSRFGPYHLARLNGLAECGRKTGIEVIGIELAEYDSDYQWERCVGTAEFERRTVFSKANYHALSKSQIGRGIKYELNQVKPVAVAINGWSVPEARAAITWCHQQPRTRAILMSETKEDDAHRGYWKETIKRLILKKFNSAVVGGRKQRDYLIKLGFPSDRIFIGYDVVDVQYFTKEATRARAHASEVRRKLSLPEDYFLICTRFLPRKNVDGLLAAYSVYRERSSENPWDLVIAGSGPELSRLQDFERKLRLKGVKWVGFIQYDGLPFYYGLANAFIHPAKNEPWGLVVNEAAASALPLVVSQTVGAAYEMVDDGVNGILFNPTSTEDMCRALLQISEMNAQMRSRMGRESLSISQKWSPQRFGGALLAATQAAMLP